MAVVRGIGWAGGAGWGRVRAGLAARWAGADAADQPPAGRDIRNYGRFTRHARFVAHALHLAMEDAAITGPGDLGPRGAGLVGTGELGTLDANLAYYRDYLRNGRVMARGNLFLYTLPTSPLAEAALAFRLRGPLAWLGGDPAGGLAAAFEAAVAALDAGEASTMFVCHGQAEAAVLYTVRAAGPGGWPARTVLEAARAAEVRGVYPAGLEVGQGVHA